MVKSQNVKMEIQRTQVSETCTIHGQSLKQVSSMP